jgi:hypothetical protein
MRPEQMWFNPADTREVWLASEQSSNIRMARYATNTPET